MERTDLIRDLENTGDRVRAMYPDAMAAPQPLRHLMNTLIPRVVTALRDADAIEKADRHTYESRERLEEYFREVCAQRDEALKPIRSQFQAILGLCQAEAAKVTTGAERIEGALMAAERSKNLAEQACARAEAAAERAKKAAERHKR